MVLSTNRELYIESQSKSYLLRRDVGLELKFNHKFLCALGNAQSNLYQHSFPTELIMGSFESRFFDVSCDIFNVNLYKLYGSKHFINFFQRITTLSIYVIMNT